MFRRIIDSFWVARAAQKARRGDVAGAANALDHVSYPRQNRALVPAMRAHLSVVNGNRENAIAEVAEARRCATSGSNNARFIRLYCDSLEGIIKDDIEHFNKAAMALQDFPKCNAKDLLVITPPASEQAMREIRAMFVSRAIH